MVTIGVMIGRIGPYHLARLRGAASKCRLIAIEMAGTDNFTGYEEVSNVGGIERVTIFPGQSVERLPATTVISAVRQTLSQVKLDALAITSWSCNYSLAALEWCVLNGLPTVCMSESNKYDHRRHWHKEFIKSQIVSLFSSALVGGQDCADYVAELGIPRERIALGYDVVDNEHFVLGSEAARRDAPAERSRLNLPQRYMLAVTRMIPKKNLSCLLYAWAEFIAASPEPGWHLVIVGDGPERGALEDLAAKLEIADKICFAGRKTYAELPAFYGLAEGFLLTSISEQWGLVVNEAMAAGLPIVISERCGCARELVQSGVTGFTFDPFKPSELASHLVRLTGDELLRQSMGNAGRARIARLTPENFGEGLMFAAQAAIEAPRPRMSLTSRALVQFLMRRRHEGMDTKHVTVERVLAGAQ